MTLRRRLERIPPGLEPYFQHMFDTLDDFYQVETAQMFRVAVATPFYVPLVAYSVLYRGDPLAVRVADDLSTEVRRVEREELISRLTKRIQGRCRDLLEINKRQVHFLHRTVRDFLSTDEMTSLLDARTGSDFDVDRTICRICLVGLRYLNHYMDSDREGEGTMKWLLPAFFHHARLVEDKHQYAPADLHDAYVVVTSDMHDPWITELPERPRLLALMNLPHELQRWTSSFGEHLAPNLATKLLENTLYYLVAAGDTGDWHHVTLETTLSMDLERRGFRPDIVPFLLGYRADLNTTNVSWSGRVARSSIWTGFLMLMGQITGCAEYRRAMLLKVCAELIRAGAQVRARDKGLEEKSLAAIFGYSDAQWLIAIRKENTGVAWKWWPWTSGKS